ncbi:uncharacterized protein LOC114310783 [Camellia sinensis]|uniref:uncharacterized protein LOC114310783 n=1 Tax=Camellia sinensis TaxID=4442 RepID=UPI001036CCA9|nr:uncharacterized protein LOC114310783 [Camellia sinensis]
MDESEKIDLELKRSITIHVDVSSENNNFIVASSSSTSSLCENQSSENQSNNASSELLEVANAEKVVDTADVNSQMEHLPPSESSEPEGTRKSGKCNLRKSLAWDTAFFTSAGVLDPDELSSMIEGVDKGRKHFLPGIDEEICRSTDSLSTLESDLTLESLEADLFEDIRASIQKSSKASHMASSSKAPSGEAETQPICTLKKVNLTSKTMMNPKPASKKPNIGMQGPGKLTKQSSGFSQGTQPVARNGGPTSSLEKAPKVIGRPNPISSAALKRSSLCGNQVKSENDKEKSASVPGKVAPSTKIHGLGGSCRAVHKPALSSKASSSSSSTLSKTKPPPKSSSLTDSSGSASSANVGISPVNSTRRKIVSSSVNPTSSSSILKTQAKVALKKKGQSGLSACLMSSKLSSNNTSPASSISEWSSESSSSTSTVNQRSNTSRASIDTSSPCTSLDNGAPSPLDHRNQSNDQISDRHEIKATRLSSENVNTTSMQTGAHVRPDMVKPSGLRMPSPKIGFFDGVRTPKGNPQSIWHFLLVPKDWTCEGVVPSIGSSSVGNSSKAKLSKLQPARIVTATGNMKPNTRKPVSPVPSQKLSNASTKVSSASQVVKNCPSASPQVHNEMNGESCLKAEEVGPKGPNEANPVPDAGLDAETTGSLGVTKSEMKVEKQRNTNLNDVKIAPIEGYSFDSKTHCNAENIKLSEEVGEDAICGLQNLKDNLCSLYKRNDKENTTHSEDQVDGTSIQIRTKDSKQELQKELIGNSISQIDFSHPDSGQKESPSNLSGPTLISLSPATIEIAAPTRTPFTVKNSFCNGEGFDLSAKSSTRVVEKTTSLPSVESAQTENS